MTCQLKVGSRGSSLARWQTNWVLENIGKKFPSLKVESEIIHTTGDKILDSPLSKIGEKGLFTKELDRALLDQQIDFAVHSLKDLPTLLPEGLFICAITEREESRDALLSKGKKPLSKLPPSAVIATGSLRRKAQLLVHCPTFQVVDLRGNVDSRLKKFHQSSWDAMILASAGLKRLGLYEYVTELISTKIMIPAPGQGSLAIVCRQEDKKTKEVLETLNHLPSSLAVRSERAFLKALEGGCQVPLGAWAELKGKELELHGFVSSLNGQKYLRNKMSGNPEKPEELGNRLADDFLARGAREILDEIQEGGRA